MRENSRPGTEKVFAPRLGVGLSGAAACICLAVLLITATASADETPPHPHSAIIKAISFEATTQRQAALGSDQFGATWALDGAIYVAWGDGAGFGAADYTEQNGPARASLGVSRIDGPGGVTTAVNVWGGKNALSKQPPTKGKTSAGVIAIDKTIYLYVLEQDVWTRSALWTSDDDGMTWKNHGWILDEPDGAFSGVGILQFGRAYAGARDEYVYGYAETGFTNGIGMFRVPKRSLGTRGAYAFFAGTDSRGAPIWSADVNNRQPVFTDANGAQWGVTCVYDAPIDRYLLAVRHNGESGEWGLFDAPEPWGPWTTVAYGRDMPAWTYRPSGVSNRPSYMHSFPTKWMSSDGKTLWQICDRGDSFNVARATLALQDHGTAARGH